MARQAGSTQLVELAQAAARKGGSRTGLLGNGILSPLLLLFLLLSPAPTGLGGGAWSWTMAAKASSGDGEGALVARLDEVGQDGGALGQQGRR